MGPAGLPGRSCNRGPLWAAAAGWYPPRRLFVHHCARRPPLSRYRAALRHQPASIGTGTDWSRGQLHRARCRFACPLRNGRNPFLLAHSGHSCSITRKPASGGEIFSRLRCTCARCIHGGQEPLADQPHRGFPGVRTLPRQPAAGLRCGVRQFCTLRSSCSKPRDGSSARLPRCTHTCSCTATGGTRRPLDLFGSRSRKQACTDFCADPHRTAVCWISGA